MSIKVSDIVNPNEDPIDKEIKQRAEYYNNNISALERDIEHSQKKLESMRAAQSEFLAMTKEQYIKSKEPKTPEPKIDEKK